MTNLKGTIIASTIVPSSSGDTYPTHDEAYGKGGYRTVDTVEDLKSISSERVKQGMLVYVSSGTTDEIGEYRLISGDTSENEKWERTDKYNIEDALSLTNPKITWNSISGYSSITSAATFLGYTDEFGMAKIDTTKKALDVLMYMYAISNMNGDTPQPPTPIVGDDGYYIMKIDNYDTSWIQQTTNEERNELMSVSNWENYFYLNSVPALNALSRISGKTICYIDDLPLNEYKIINDMCTDDYDVISFPLSSNTAFYFLINSSITVSKNNFNITTDFTDDNILKPEFDDMEVYVAVSETSSSDVYTTNKLSQSVATEHPNGLTDCLLYIGHSGFYSVDYGLNKVAIKIPKINRS